MRKPALLAMLISIAPMANADVLWDQSEVTAGVNAYQNQEILNDQTHSTYIVSDITVPAGGWTIQTMTLWYSAAASDFSSVGTGRTFIFPKTGALPLPGDDPSLHSPVPITIAPNGPGEFTLTATLNQPLAAGDYWIGLTPQTSLSNGQAFLHGNSFNRGDNDAIRNPFGGFGFPFGTNWGPVAGIDGLQRWQASMRLDGVPEPSSVLLLGLGALALMRRR